MKKEEIKKVHVPIQTGFLIGVKCSATHLYNAPTMDNNFAGYHSKTIPCNGTICPMVTDKIQRNRASRIKLDVQLLFFLVHGSLVGRTYRCMGYNEKALQ